MTEKTEKALKKRGRPRKNPLLDELNKKEEEQANCEPAIIDTSVCAI